MASIGSGPLFILLSAVLWSMGGLFVKTSSWSGVSVATYRGLVSFVFFLLLLGRRTARPDRRTLVMAVCFFSQSALYLIANKFAPAGIVAALEYTSPVYIILFTALRARKRPPLRDCVTCALLLLGILLTTTGAGSASALGCALALLSGVFYAGVFYLGARRRGHPLEPYALGNALYFLLLPALISDPAIPGGGLSGFAGPTALAILCGCAAWWFFQRGIQDCTALQANFIAMVEPVLAPVWPLLLLGERMSALSVAGCALVIGTLIAYHAGRREKA